MTRVDLLVPLMHHDPDRSWITDPDPHHAKGHSLRYGLTGASKNLSGLTVR